MNKQPRHRPQRSFANAKRVIVECDVEKCVDCGQPLVHGRSWHVRKTIQTMEGPLFVAGRSKRCTNPACQQSGKFYHASGVLRYSLPHSTYGLDVLAYIGWQHEKEQRQLSEIQRDLNGRGILVNERNVGKLYRQFLALLGGASAKTLQVLQATAEKQGGLMWAIDALQPEGHGTLLYVLYEVLSGSAVSALQSDHPTAEELSEWLKPYQALPYPALATLSDGEDAIIAALNKTWPQAVHQRCQSHALSNLAEAVHKHDTQLRRQMRQDLGGLPAVPEQREVPIPADTEKLCVAQLAAVALGITEAAQSLTPAKDRSVEKCSAESCAAAENALAQSPGTCDAGLRTEVVTVALLQPLAQMASKGQLKLGMSQRPDQR
jgi:hypothetical protein